MEGRWWWYVAVEVATLVGDAVFLSLADSIKPEVFDLHSGFLGLAVLSLVTLVGGLVGENFRKRVSIVI